MKPGEVDGLEFDLVGDAGVVGADLPERYPTRNSVLAVYCPQLMGSVIQVEGDSSFLYLEDLANLPGGFTLRCPHQALFLNV